ncbi:MAG: RiPP maturation radical SAM protein 1 [Acidobacteria bacterium]|nr:MAG: RiPP maturation radical SAM protein 1 [Acidobacteriota bacterium]
MPTSEPPCRSGTEVVLVSMPFADLERPSIALGLLKAGLARRGIGAEVIYANLSFAARVGLETYRAVIATPTDHLLGEWCFSGAAFPDFAPDHEAFLDLTLAGGEATEALVRRARGAAAAFLDRLAVDVLARRPRLVGCSSLFQQHCASLALLRRIRELDPAVVTVLGGANCEGEMGRATLDACPFVDLVVSGEADELFPPLCRRLLDRGRDVDPAALPYGVLSRGGGAAAAGHRPAPRATVGDLDALPLPDYDDYFAQLARSPLRRHVKPGLPVESSRGCWWGEKSHCTFCGLNGSGMGYRTKSARRVLDELAALAARYDRHDFDFVDNILDLGHVESVLGELARDDRGYNLFYETKANLKRRQIEILARAGARWLQPGIESLDDRVLALIGKGNSAAINVQLMKWARTYGVRLSWNVLCDLPGESQSWYRELAGWLPLLFHLEPPVVVVRVRYDRFSPYHMRPEDFGLNLVPCRTYPFVYPLPPDQLERLAYYFEDAGRLAPDLHRGRTLEPGHQRLERVVAAWQEAWRRDPPLLRAVDDGERTVIHDSRPCARAGRFTLEGRARAVYRLCDRARAPAALVRALAAEEGAELAWRDVAPTVAALCRTRLMMLREGRYLSLAVDGDPQPLPRDADFPGGFTSLRPLAPAATAGSDRLAATAG